jgi:beta-galactosidase beta subunit
MIIDTIDNLGKYVALNPLFADVVEFLNSHDLQTLEAGKRNGAAIEEDKEGMRFEGYYKDDVRDGKFVEKDRNGKVVASGTYTRGHRQLD